MPALELPRHLSRNGHDPAPSVTRPCRPDEVAELAERLGRDRQEVAAELQASLAEMSVRRTPAGAEAWSRLGRFLLRAYDLQLDDETGAFLRSLERQATLIYLPNHRSYLDMWTVGEALRRWKLKPLWTLGGSNLDFWPFGNIARNAGMVWIRRSFKDDPVYKYALRHQLAELLLSGESLGWAIEGGRTRTGKLRPPRYGVLRYVVDAVQKSGDREVLLVPMSVDYDQLHEVALMVGESRGARKKQEGAAWLARFAVEQRRALGQAYLHVGEPVPLRARLQQLEEEGAEATAIARIAVEVSHRINRATPVTPVAAVTLALLAGDRALTAGEVADTVEPLARYLERRGHRCAPGARLRDGATIHEALGELVSSGVALRYDGGGEPVWAIGPDQHLVAAFYRNTGIHVLVDRAIAEVVAGDEDPEAAALALRDLLKFEFFFAGKDEFLAGLRTELELLEEHPEPRLAHLVLRPFVEAYHVVADVLAALRPDETIATDALLDRCLGVGRERLLRRRMATAESISLELFKTGVRLAGHRGLLDGGGDGGAARHQFALELAQVSSAVQERRP